MCCEDVNIGRNSIGDLTTVVVGATSTQVVGPNADRVSLVFSAPIAGRVTVSIANPAVDGVGLVISAGSGLVELNIREHGPIVTLAWFGIADDAGRQLSILQTLFSGCKRGGLIPPQQ